MARAKNGRLVDQGAREKSHDIELLQGKLKREELKEAMLQFLDDD